MLLVNKKYESLYKILSPKYEATMKGGGSGDEYKKYNYSYALAVIDKLLNGEKVRLGSKGDSGVLDGSLLDDSQKDALRNLSNNINGTSSKDFNDAINGTGVKWTNIFKGDFTGYSAGLASKNKGNAFEDFFVENFDKFEPEIKAMAKYKERVGEPISVGGLNQKRPLTFSSGKITCGPAGNYNIGKTVADVVVPVDKSKVTGDDKVYLSLKSGNTVTFVNSGVKKLFTNEFFEGGKLKGDGKTLLDMLCIDENAFRDVFVNYSASGKKSKASKQSKNITSMLQSNAMFTEFMRSVIGYGFIMVHQISGTKVEYINFLKESDLNDLLSSIEYAEVQYPVGGEAKRVDVLVKYPKIEVKLNIRSKDGGVFPTHIMADYKFIK